jgi:hypothetical protein
LDTVEVNDPKLGVINASIGALAPGETKTITMQSSLKVEEVSIPEVTGFPVVPGTQIRISGVQMRLFKPSATTEDFLVAMTAEEEDAEYLCL